MTEPREGRVPFQCKSFVCIEYPAVVRSPEKMLETLGGTAMISKVYNEPNLRLQLRFRPKDPFCKPAYGELTNTTRLLLKVKRVPKSKVLNPTSDETKDDCTYQSEILGVVKHTFKFTTMADFQYLPMERVGDGGEYESILQKTLPTQLCPYSWLKDESEEAPNITMIQPIIFSRTDKPSDNYYFRKEPRQTRSSGSGLPATVAETVISRLRQKRAGFTVFANFDDDDIPKKNEKASELLFLRCDPVAVGLVQKAFEERPIWSRRALMGRTECQKSHLGYILPAFAYFMITGPWRSLWVKFGCDPRREPSTKIYQLLDFRLRKQEPLVGTNGKRTNRTTINVLTVNQRPKTAVIERDAFAQAPHVPSKDSEQSKEEETQKVLQQRSTYEFREGILPPLQQMYYQFVDIHVEEVQTLVHQNDGAETKCSEKDGWCLPGTANRCREILFAHTRQLMKDEEKDDAREAPQSSEMEVDPEDFDNDLEKEMMDYSDEDEH